MTEGDQQNSEINQYNLCGERHISLGELGTLDSGGSLQAGRIFNSITRRKGERYAVAGHANANLGRWNLCVQTGALDFPFLMAAKGQVYSINVARSFNASLGPLTGGAGIGRNATTAGKWRSRLNVNIGFYF